jgi:hypothetical protein
MIAVLAGSCNYMQDARRSQKSSSTAGFSFLSKQWLSIPGGAVNEDGGGSRSDLAWLLDGATGVVQERLLPGARGAHGVKYWSLQRR